MKSLQEEKAWLKEEMSVLSEMMQKAVKENSCIAQDQDEYLKRYHALEQRYDATKEQHDKIEMTISAREAESTRITEFIMVLKTQDGVIRKFDDRLWGSMVRFVTVGKKKEITVTFRHGTKIWPNGMQKSPVYRILAVGMDFYCYQIAKVVKYNKI